MSKRPLLWTLLGALIMSVAVLNSHAASTTRLPTSSTSVELTADPAIFTSGTSAKLSCGEVLCHANSVECSSGTIPCGGCVIPPGSFFGHCANR